MGPTPRNDCGFISVYIQWHRAFVCMCTKSYSKDLVFLSTFADDFQHVSLRVTGQQGSDYINASWVNVSQGRIMAPNNIITA